jgi:FdhD protein
MPEDIGRHNALDKAIGKVLLDGTQKKAVIVILTSRLSFEMVQKAACLGAEILAGESSATSSAIELANSCELTLIGFLRGNKGNVYTHRERLIETTIAKVN